MANVTGGSVGAMVASPNLNTTVSVPLPSALTDGQVLCLVAMWTGTTAPPDLSGQKWTLVSPGGSGYFGALYTARYRSVSPGAGEVNSAPLLPAISGLYSSGFIFALNGCVTSGSVFGEVAQGASGTFDTLRSGTAIAPSITPSGTRDFALFIPFWRDGGGYNGKQYEGSPGGAFGTATGPATTQLATKCVGTSVSGPSQQLLQAGAYLSAAALSQNTATGQATAAFTNPNFNDASLRTPTYGGILIAVHASADVTPTPGSGPFPGGTLALAGTLGYSGQAATVGLPGASVALSGQLGEVHGTKEGFPAGTMVLSGSVGQTSIIPPPPPLYADVLAGLALSGDVPAPWTTLYAASGPLKLYNNGSGVPALGGLGITFPGSYYKNTISKNQYVEWVWSTSLSSGLYARAYIRCDGRQFYSVKLNTLVDANDNAIYSLQIEKSGNTLCRLDDVGSSWALSGQKWRFEASSLLDLNAPVRLRLYINDYLIVETWDTSNPLNTGFPGFSAESTGGYNVSKPLIEQVNIGETAVPPTPGTGEFTAGSMALSGQVGAPTAGSGAFTAGAMALSGQAGAPVAVAGAFAAGSLAMSGAPLGGVVSRLKASVVYPSFSAFGGLDSFTGATKGQMTTDGADSIGYRVGLGNDGASGDRAFFTVPAAKVLTADVPTDPVGKATFHCTFLTMMSWDYKATGAAANPSGTAFKLWRVTGGSGMSATLVGSDGKASTDVTATPFGTITARPIWLSGQTWYDGTTKGYPVWECEVDITALYNLAAQSGGDLQFALECQFTDTKWLAEIAGADPNLAWARPRIEVHRWGAVAIDCTESDPATDARAGSHKPEIIVTPTPVFLYGTTWRYPAYTVRWGYDEINSPLGGVYKYSNLSADATAQRIEGTIEVPERTETAGQKPSAPIILESVDPSSRIFVMIDVHYLNGDLRFTRTFKTRQVLKPKLKLLGHDYTATTDPTGATGVPAAAKRWLDVASVVQTNPPAHGNAWYALAKRHTGAWAGSTPYVAGDRVILSSGAALTATNSGTSGTAEPVAPSSVGQKVQDNDIAWARQGTDTVGDRWELYLAQDYIEDYAFRNHVGNYNPSALGMFPLPYATIVGTALIGGSEYAVPPGPNLFLDYDDIGQAWYDRVSLAWYFLSSKYNGTTGYDIRLNCVRFGDDNGAPLGPYMWTSCGGLSWVSTVLYTATAAPDLRKLSAVGRACDWRHSIPYDFFPSLLISFVADGRLRVFSTCATTDFWDLTNYNGSAPLPNLTTEINDDVSALGLTDLKFESVLTRLGTHYTMIVGTGTGAAYLRARADDLYVPDTMGVGFNFTAGAWTAQYTPASGQIKAVWVTEVQPADANGHMPDDHTALLAALMADGTVRFLTFSGGSVITALNGVPALAPDADFMAATVWDRDQRAVGRWPFQGGYQKIITAMNGGAIGFKWSGSTLTVQRVTDLLRVSDEVSLDVGVAILDVLVARATFQEGIDVPVLVKASDGWHTVLVSIGLSYDRLYLPIENLRRRFSSGKLDISNLSKTGSNQRDPSEFVRLVGHNHFSVGFEFDLEPDGSYVTNPRGMMNEGSFNYFCIKGCAGERVRLTILNVPAFGGIWRSGVIRPPTHDTGYHEECLGGAVWVNLKFTTWWWTNDPPGNPDRRWHRVLDGMDYVLDGESQGGAYIINLVSPGDTLYLAHDLVHDVETWKGAFSGFKNAPGGQYIKWASNKGELLTGVGPNANLPLSQTGRMP